MRGVNWPGVTGLQESREGFGSQKEHPSAGDSAGKGCPEGLGWDGREISVGRWFQPARGLISHRLLPLPLLGDRCDRGAVWVSLQPDPAGAISA